MKLKSHWYSQISWIIGAYEGRISWIFGALELRIYWITANLQDIRSLWSVKFPDIWGLWSTTIRDICKFPGYLGPRASAKGQVGRSCTIVPALGRSVLRDLCCKCSMSLEKRLAPWSLLGAIFEWHNLGEREDVIIIEIFSQYIFHIPQPFFMCRNCLCPICFEVYCDFG